MVSGLLLVMVVMVVVMVVVVVMMVYVPLMCHLPIAFFPLAPNIRIFVEMTSLSVHLSALTTQQTTCATQAKIRRAERERREWG